MLSPTHRSRKDALVRLLGPAFIAAIAYVDPGNVAANMTAGARYGYLLLWVLVVGNVMAVVVQYQAAKLGIVTGQSLPQVMSGQLSKRSRLLYWAQAELVICATDLAEIIGGAIALQLLFGLPLVVGGLITTVVSLLLLSIQNRRSQSIFEFVVMGLLLIITIGFLTGLFFLPPDPQQMAVGLIPRFDGGDSVLVAASMLGATVMPHAIYLHSSLVIHWHGEKSHQTQTVQRLLQASRWDVLLALFIAGTVNIGLLLLAASALQGVPGTDDIAGAHQAIHNAFGSSVAFVFAIGLLASGLASTSVGSYAGSEIMRGLLKIDIPLLARRTLTALPALLILGLGINPTFALVLSQVVLSFGIPFALIPLVRLTSSKKLMGAYTDVVPLRIFSWLSVAVVVGLNLLLIVLTLQEI